MDSDLEKEESFEDLFADIEGARSSSSISNILR